VADVLENEGNFGQADLSTQQVVMIIPQFFVGKVIPTR
jgi:hypothetical protein